MGYQVVENVSSLKNRCVTFVDSGPIWPLFYGSILHGVVSEQGTCPIGVKLKMNLGV